MRQTYPARLIGLIRQEAEHCSMLTASIVSHRYYQLCSNVSLQECTWPLAMML